VGKGGDRVKEGDGLMIERMGFAVWLEASGVDEHGGDEEGGELFGDGEVWRGWRWDPRRREEGGKVVCDEGGG
jgi:hypothetical protein